MRRTTPRGWRWLSALATVALTTMLLAGAAWARPWLGVYTQEITGELRDGLDLHGDGVLVNRVVDGSPADRAGLRKGDVIVRYNSRGVGSPDELARLVGDSRNDQEIELSILRDGRSRSLSVQLAERPSDDEEMSPRAPEAPEAPQAPEAPPAPRAKHDMKFKIVTPDDDQGDGHAHVYRWEGDLDPEQMNGWMRQLPGNLGDLGNLRMLGMLGGRGRLGVRIESLSDDLASALGAPDKEGVLVLGVMKDTPAEKAGLRAGDVITSVDDHKVADTEALVRAIGDADGKVSLGVWRKGAKRTVEAELEDGARRLHREMSMDEDRSGDKRKVIRLRDHDSTDDGDLRQQIDELRQQLRELKQQLEERHHD